MYEYLTEELERRFETVEVLKEQEGKRIVSVRHKETRTEYALLSLQASGDLGECYRRLLPVSHPNLPQIYEVAEKEDRLLVLEEYIKGDSAADMLRENCFTPAEVRRIALDVCQALIVLHGRGIVHRDVKPENLVLRGERTILLDLDASRVRKEEQASDTMILGTIGYAAPEQFGISQSDGRADIYALGVTMNQMLTGEHPSVRLAGGRFGRIISRCTMIDPNLRFPDARSLMEVLA